jgi:hypothetical protein
MDTHKETIVVAIATNRLNGNIRHYGQIMSRIDAIDKLVAKLKRGTQWDSRWPGMAAISRISAAHGNQGERKRGKVFLKVFSFLSTAIVIPPIRPGR